MSGQEPGVGQSRADWNHLSLLVIVSNTGSPERDTKRATSPVLAAAAPTLPAWTREAAGSRYSMWWSCGQSLLHQSHVTGVESGAPALQPNPGMVLEGSQGIVKQRGFQSSGAFWNAAEHHTPKGSIVTPVVQGLSTLLEVKLCQIWHTCCCFLTVKNHALFPVSHQRQKATIISERVLTLP